jgi:hypothetical protein
VRRRAARALGGLEGGRACAARACSARRVGSLLGPPEYGAEPLAPAHPPSRLLLRGESVEVALDLLLSRWSKLVKTKAEMSVRQAHGRRGRGWCASPERSGGRGARLGLARPLPRGALGRACRAAARPCRCVRLRGARGARGARARALGAILARARAHPRIVALALAVPRGQLRAARRAPASARAPGRSRALHGAGPPPCMKREQSAGTARPRPEDGGGGVSTPSASFPAQTCLARARSSSRRAWSRAVRARAAQPGTRAV